MTQENNPSYFDTQYAQEDANASPSAVQAVVPTVHSEIVQEHGIAEYKPSRQMRRLAGYADLAVQHEYHRAEIANAILQNTALLAQRASLLAEMMPEDKDIFREIVRTFAASSVSRIQEW